jgi:hypothetical protein
MGKNETAGARRARADQELTRESYAVLLADGIGRRLRQLERFLKNPRTGSPGLPLMAMEDIVHNSVLLASCLLWEAPAGCPARRFLMDLLEPLAPHNDDARALYCWLKTTRGKKHLDVDCKDMSQRLRQVSRLLECYAGEVEQQRREAAGGAEEMPAEERPPERAVLGGVVYGEDKVRGKQLMLLECLQGQEPVHENAAAEYVYGNCTEPSLHKLRGLLGDTNRTLRKLRAPFEVVRAPKDADHLLLRRRGSGG